MKLGEALTQRKYLAARIPQLTNKLSACITIEEGAATNEASDTAVDLLAELGASIAQFHLLVVAINKTNNVSQIADGTTIMEAIVRRDLLKLGLQQYQSIVQHIRPRVEKSHFVADSEPTVYVVAPGIQPAALKQHTNHLAAEYRKLDTMLQEANWTVDLIEDIVA